MQGTAWHEGCPSKPFWRMVPLWQLRDIQMASQLPLPHPGPMSGELPDPVRRSDGDRAIRSDAVPSNAEILSVLTSSPTAAAAAKAGSEESDILAMVRRGFPIDALKNLVGAVGVTQKEVASVVGIPATTLGRRRKNGRLTPLESDHVVRVARLAVMARTMMAGDADAARRWLTAPHRLLGNETPLGRASTETGGREVEQLIGQLRHGVFS